MHRVANNARGYVAGFVEQAIGGHNPRDYSQGERARGIDGIASQCELGGSRCADAASEEPRAARSRSQSELDKALGETGSLRCDTNIAHHCQIEASAHRRAVDGGNDWDL